MKTILLSTAAFIIVLPFAAAEIAVADDGGVAMTQMEEDSSGPVATTDLSQFPWGKNDYDQPETMTLSFIVHIDEQMAEQDVFHEMVPGSGEVFRPTAATRCKDDEGKLDIAFGNLVPGGIYTTWYDFKVWPPREPFIGTYDLPLRARDGSENSFIADAEGDARFTRTLT